MKILKILLTLGAVLVLPLPGFAAYQNPTVVSNQPQSSGFVKVVFQFTGNAGEPTREREYLVRPNTTAIHLRNWVADTRAELDLLHTASIIPSLQTGQTVTALARVIPSPTAKEVWNEKHDRYRKYKDSGLLGATYASNLAALKADLEATYQAGFLD